MKLEKIVSPIKKISKIAGTLTIIYGFMNGCGNLPRDPLNPYNRPSAMFRTESTMKKALDYQNNLFNKIYNKIIEKGK